MRGAWILAEYLSHLLDPSEREAVLGDLVEGGEGPWHSLAGVGGLVTRRQAGLWSNWRPWVAAFGVSFPSSFLLMGYSVAIYSGFAGIAASGTTAHSLATDIEALVFQALLLAARSWSCGYLVGSLSRRTIWFSIISYCSPCLFCLYRFRIESLSRFSLFLFVLPAAAGLLHGIRRLGMETRIALPAAAIVTSMAVVMRMAAHGVGGDAWGWLCSIILTWPSWYVAGASLNKAAKRKRSEIPAFEMTQHEIS
jgi:hypothetical protein